jgi:hypothetical protein
VSVERRGDVWRARYRDGSGRQHAKHFRTKALAEVWERKQRRGVIRDEGYRADLRTVLGGKPASTVLPDGDFKLLYRCWGPHQQLLYVGVTGNGFARVQQHAVKGWFEREVIVVTFERIPADVATKIERDVIAKEDPKHNIQSRVRHVG